jgi:hypothetical protein
MFQFLLLKCRGQVPHSVSVMTHSAQHSCIAVSSFHFSPLQSTGNFLCGATMMKCLFFLGIYPYSDCGAEHRPPNVTMEAVVKTLDVWTAHSSEAPRVLTWCRDASSRQPACPPSALRRDGSLLRRAAARHHGQHPAHAPGCVPAAVIMTHTGAIHPHHPKHTQHWIMFDHRVPGWVVLCLRLGR